MHLISIGYNIVIAPYIAKYSLSLSNLKLNTKRTELKE
jgi:hypothetical protein